MTDSSHFVRLRLPERYDLDLDALEDAYFDCQRLTHPDRFSGRNDQEKLAAAQEAAAVNEAYQTLKDPLLRANYLLARQGLRVNGHNDTVKPSPALLMEIMERHESLEEAANPAKLASLLEEITGEIEACLAQLISAFALEDYEQAAHIALRLRYLRTIAEELQRRT